MNKGKAYLAVQVILCVLVVVMLSAAAIGIFRDGKARQAENPLDHIYTAEDVAERFTRVAPLLFAALGIGAAGLLLGVKDPNADKPVKDAELERDLITSRVAQPSAEMKKESSRQRLVWQIGWVAFGLCMIPILIYCMKIENFPQGNLEGMIAALALGVFPWLAAGLACLITAGILEERSIRREIDAAKAQMKAEKAAGVTQPAAGAEKEKNYTAVRAVLLAAAIVLIVMGIFNGSLEDVLVKAINICTECIGLG